MSRAEQLLEQADPQAALLELQQEVRRDAADPKLRVFLFQLLCVLGQWQRAEAQLKLCGELDAGTLAMVHTYGPALACETLRESVFAGRSSPHVFAPPSPWVTQLAQALMLDGQGRPAEAAAARSRALEEASASRGRLDGDPFAWIADADSRLGPVLEIVLNGRYGWLPFEQIAMLTLEPVADLRDLVWAPARLLLVTGRELVGLIPVRYAGSCESGDGELELARRTEWLELAEGQYRGVGQRVLVTDRREAGLLELRELVIEPAAAA
ncbi:virulence protein SciE type [Rubrivivax gelatinosus]|nr:virulence protein SciE type [Rubrivivax gelatinosus]